MSKLHLRRLGCYPWIALTTECVQLVGSRVCIWYYVPGIVDHFVYEVYTYAVGIRQIMVVVVRQQQCCGGHQA